MDPRSLVFVGDVVIAAVIGLAIIVGAAIVASAIRGLPGWRSPESDPYETEDDDVD